MMSSPVRRVLLSITRVLICSILLSALLSACLYLHHTAFPFLEDHLSATNKKATAWLVGQLRFSLPFILICLFFAISYRGVDRRDGVATREKMWIAVLVTVFAYAVLLPYVYRLSEELYANAVASGAVIPETDVGVPWTLMLKSREWFIRLSVPLGLIIVFYAVRSARERLSPETVDDLSATEQPAAGVIDEATEEPADMAAEALSEEANNG